MQRGIDYKGAADRPSGSFGTELTLNRVLTLDRGPILGERYRPVGNNREPDLQRISVTSQPSDIAHPVRKRSLLALLNAWQKGYSRSR